MGHPFGNRKSPEGFGDILADSRISNNSDQVVSELKRKHEESLKQVAQLKGIQEAEKSKF